ncbi:hypothetical protein PM082_014186 [Marasmius tenuissimus]|nr:hypothetical protein PM082_014186 [Marasmius tenuissimus]
MLLVSDTTSRCRLCCVHRDILYSAHRLSMYHQPGVSRLPLYSEHDTELGQKRDSISSSLKPTVGLTLVQIIFSSVPHMRWIYIIFLCFCLAFTSPIIVNSIVPEPPSLITRKPALAPLGGTTNAGANVLDDRIRWKYLVRWWRIEW